MVRKIDADLPFNVRDDNTMQFTYVPLHRELLLS